MAQNELPGLVAFSKFIVEVLTEFENRITQEQRKLGKNIFQKPETYKLFPGINMVTSQIHTAELPRIDLGKNFNTKNLQEHLDNHPKGFIAEATDYYNERVVLPNRQFVQMHAYAPRGAAAAEREENSSKEFHEANRGDNRTTSVCHKHIFIHYAKDDDPNATRELTNAEMMAKCNSLLAQPNNCEVLTLTPHPGPTGWPEMITVAPDLQSMKKFMTALYGEEISRERLLNQTFVMGDCLAENSPGVYSTPQALREDMIADLPAPTSSRSITGGGGMGYPPRRGFRPIVKHGAAHDTSIYISN